MSVEFCPICGSVLDKVPITIHGVVYDFWVCPEGDWEDPVNSEAVNAAKNQNDSE
jgi:hypothetical protein